MNNSKSFSRRSFMKTTAMASTALVGSAALPSSIPEKKERYAKTVFCGEKLFACRWRFRFAFFSTGKQFVYDTAPVKSNDGPNSFTDEDWIPHTAAWLTGLMRL